MVNSLNRQEKEQVVTEMSAVIKDAGGIFVTDYRGLTVEQMTKLRADVRKAGGSFKVVKNTLLERAVEGTEYASLVDFFSGTTAVVIGKDDIAAVAKALKNFAKDAEKLQIRGGAMAGRKLTAKDVEALADLPSLDQLRAMLAGMLQQPAARIVGVLQAPGAQVARVLKAYADKQA